MWYTPFFSSQILFNELQTEKNKQIYSKTTQGLRHYGINYEVSVSFKLNGLTNLAFNVVQVIGCFFDAYEEMWPVQRTRMCFSNLFGHT